MTVRGLDKSLADSATSRGRTTRISALWDGIAGWAARQPSLRVLGTIWIRLLDEFCAILDPFLARFRSDRRLIAVVKDQGSLELHTATRAGVESTDAAALENAAAQKRAKTWSAVELRLRPDQVLHRTLTLPAASREFLGPIIEHRLERLTPWRLDKVLHGFRVTGETDGGASIVVAVTLTSTDIVAAPLAALQGLGLVPTAIGADSGPLVEPLAISVRRDTDAHAAKPLRRMVSAPWLTGCAILSILVVGSWVWDASAEGARVAAESRLVKSRRLLAATLGGAEGEGGRSLLADKRPDKTMVVLIDALATALPANTYLRDMTIMPAQVRLSGVSADAASLIPLLERAGLFDVRFTAPVTRGNGHTETFEITADRAVAPAEAP